MLRWLAAGVGLLAMGSPSPAAVPPPERLLPDDTLVFVTAPDFGKLKDIYRHSSQSQFWNDPAMKPFKDKFTAKWQEDLVQPLERELGLKLEDYASLPQGQVTFALTQNGWDGKAEPEPAWLLLLDTRDKSSQLKSNLTTLRKKWVDAGKNLRTEKIRGLEFSVVSLSSNDIPKTLRKLFPLSSPSQDAPADAEAKSTPSKTDLLIGQADSLLILGDSTKAVDKIVARLTGGTIPPLGDLPAYQANHQAMFRDAPLYGWVNLKAFIDVLARQAAESKPPDPTDPLAGLSAQKALAATGLTGLKTLAFTVQHSGEGTLFQLFLGVPEPNRQGFFKILAGEPKDPSPPPFVPADTVKFQRWRVDGQSAWATLEKMLSDLSPQFAGALSFMFDTANNAAKEKDPGFDVRKNLIGNLGNDLIHYEKARRDSTGPDTNPPPSLWLVGSPNAAQLAAALKNVLSLQGGPPTEREFLGRKIYSLPAPMLPLAMMTGAKPPPPRTLSYTASGGYVALTTNPSILEEYLRSSDSSAKTLRDSPGLVDAMQKVSGPGTCYFGYDNQAETMRTAFESLRKDSANAAGAASATVLPGAPPIPSIDATFKDWVDFSLLPPFDKVAKYFSFAVYGGGATTDGLALKVFAPVPPQLRN